MKFLFNTALFGFVFSVLFARQALAAIQTNLAGVSVYAGEGLHISESPADAPLYVVYADKTREEISNQYIALFINGSIIKNAKLVVEKDRTLLPLRLISETLGAEVKWNAATQGITISDDNATIQLTLGKKIARVDGTAMILDVAPKLFGDSTYVPTRFVAEALRSQVEYFDGRAQPQPDGTGVPQAHYFFRMPQVMISRFSETEPPLSAEKAIEKAKTELITAYEKKYGRFVSLDAKPSDSGPWTDEKEREHLRYGISNLAVTSENDRFYIMFMSARDFWVDKYTGSVLTFYNGIAMTISRFDPNSSEALTFAG